MSSSSSDTSSTTTNITQTVTPTNAVAEGGRLESQVTTVEGGIRAAGDIGLTGFDAVRILEDFSDLQRDQSLLASQNFANAAALALNSGPRNVTIPGTEKAEKPQRPGTRDILLLLGGAASVATIVALTSR